MIDQANILRDLVEQQQRHHQTDQPSSPKEKRANHARTIAVTSGKGGVGKSSIALNLAISLALTNSKVCLLDASLGLGSIDLLCGLNGYWNLSHVIAGSRQIDEIILKGPAGVDVIPGVSGLAEMSNSPAAVQEELLAQLEELESKYDYMIIDTGTGIHQTVKRFVTSADNVYVVTTPEPTSITDAYAVIKTFMNYSTPRFEVIVNQAESLEQGERIIERLQATAQLFLRSHITSAAVIPFDVAVQQAVSLRSPVMVSHPDSTVSQAITSLASRIYYDQREASCESYFSRIVHRQQKVA